MNGQGTPTPCTHPPPTTPILGGEVVSPPLLPPAPRPNTSVIGGMAPAIGAHCLPCSVRGPPPRLRVGGGGGPSKRSTGPAIMLGTVEDFNPMTPGLKGFAINIPYFTVQCNTNFIVQKIVFPRDGESYAPLQVEGREMKGAGRPPQGGHGRAGHAAMAFNLLISSLSYYSIKYTAHALLYYFFCIFASPRTVTASHLCASR